MESKGEKGCKGRVTNRQPYDDLLRLCLYGQWVASEPRAGRRWARNPKAVDSTTLNCTRARLEKKFQGTDERVQYYPEL